jgi:3-deoxy-7-phosphoheptulonate synthase
MMIVMRPNATQQHISAVVAKAEALNVPVHLSRENGITSIGLIVQGDSALMREFEIMDGVEKIGPISQPYKLTSREFHLSNSVVAVDGLQVGSGEVVIIAGPCSVESREQILEIAHAVKEAGAHALRGGAYKPRTSPYSFQGLGEEGLEYLAEAKQETGLPIVTEVMTPEQLDLVARHADVLQIGARNMQNYALLHAVGKSLKPVLLKRGMMSTIKEWLMSAEYILSHGNDRVILCERGIRTFETATRNTTDINAIPVIKSQTHLPIILDPSHSTGSWEYVASIARAGVAAGADGLIVEVHSNPAEALSDGPQSLVPEKFARLVSEVTAIVEALREKTST